MSVRPLDGIVVLEFAQFMAAPSAGLRLADLGARVMKIERPGTGEAGRQIQIKNLFVDGDSLVFHTINRNKESFTADLKNPDDRKHIEALIRRADVMTHNFRPGVMEKLGLDATAVHRLNPRVVYATVTGFGTTGPWKGRPGQDLLVQATSGLTWLTGNRDDPPTPMGLSIVDAVCGGHLVHGILAALVGRERTGVGGTVEVSLLESAIDMQFEVLTAHFADGGKPPDRAARNGAHAYLAAPYGIYRTRDGHLALAMGDVIRIGQTLALSAVADLPVTTDWFGRRDEIQALLADHLLQRGTAEWLDLLEPAGVWAADVYDYARLAGSEQFRQMGIIQTVRRASGAEVRTTRCPIRIDGDRLTSTRAAPTVGQDQAAVLGWLEQRVEASARVGSRDGKLPLDGVTIVDLSQFLAAPAATLRLADLGARVIKVEKPDGGDLCRQLYLTDVRLDGESTNFHAINRNKQSVVADLKTDAGRAFVRGLIDRADVVVHNFRPGVAERLGMGYDDVRAVRADVIYAAISGYGETGPWSGKPGQDLLVQALTGMAWLSGTADAGPVPLGLSLVDQASGMHLAQGILACLYRRCRTGVGGRVDVSMLESSADLQFEFLTAFQHDGGAPVVRSALSGAHPAVGAPYGIYAAADGYLALAMAAVPLLGRLLGCPALAAFADPAEWFPLRDEIKRVLAGHLRTHPVQHWLDRLEPADVWCARVLDWKQLLAEDGFTELGMTQTVTRPTGTRYLTTRCPITLDGRRLYSGVGSPDLGQDTATIDREFA
jgi:crotonobetainyl-CoA:carnitine CoA-transferase CaiB-like acyl-CoA transferase